MSTTKSRAVAEQYAISAALRGQSEAGAAATPLLLKLKIDSFLQCGSDISFLAVFTNEAEFVYPPCTYLEPRSEKEETVRSEGREYTVKVLEVVPHVA